MILNLLLNINKRLSFFLLFSYLLLFSIGSLFKNYFDFFYLDILLLIVIISLIITYLQSNNKKETQIQKISSKGYLLILLLTFLSMGVVFLGSKNNFGYVFETNIMTNNHSTYPSFLRLS